MRRCLFLPILAAGLLPLASAKVLLNVNMVKGFVTVSVNSQKIGTYGKKGTLDKSANAVKTVDVTKYAKAGANRLSVVWSGGKPTGEVRVSESLGAGFRKVGEVRLDVFAPASGTRTANFNVGDAKAPVGAHNAPRPGSGARQTLLTANIVKGNVSVWVNGEKVGDYAPGVVPIDVSDYAKAGANTLKVAWSGTRPTGSIRVSYAATKNAFRKLTEYDLNVFTKKTGGGTVTFKLP